MLKFARFLLYAGIVAVVLGLSKIHAAFVADPPYDYTGSSRFAWSIAYMVVLALTAYGSGLPDVPRTARNAMFTAVGAAAGAAVGVSLLQLAVGDALLPRFVVFGSALLLIPWYMLLVALASGVRSRAEDADRVLIVGDHVDLDALRSELERAPERPATIVDAVTPEDVRPRSDGSSPLIERAESESVSVIVLDRDAQADEGVVGQVADLHRQGFRVRTLSLFYERWLGKLPVGELERVSLLFDIGELHRAQYGRVKRLFDVVIGVLTIPILVLCVPVVVVGNLAANRGPLLYRQPRVGKGGRTFTIAKFRTMTPSADAELADEWTTEDDPRITKWGRVLRATHLDELPQVVNVLRGELTLVGPRPEQPHYVEELRRKLPFYEVRHLVRPGVTGWAQVKYGYAGDERDALEKLQYDFYYLRHQTFGLDLRIVGRTIRSVIGREGR